MFKLCFYFWFANLVIDHDGPLRFWTLGTGHLDVCGWIDFPFSFLGLDIIDVNIVILECCLYT